MLNNFWHPHLERCGFILKNNTVIECENISDTPQLTFKIADSDIEKYAENIYCFWHSHPSDDVNLSLKDYQLFLLYPEHKHRIYGSKVFAEYYVRRNFVMREEYDFEIS